MKSSRHTEAAFENVIEDHLLNHGYVRVKSPFNRARALFPDNDRDFQRTVSDWLTAEVYRRLSDIESPEKYSRKAMATSSQP